LSAWPSPKLLGRLLGAGLSLSSFSSGALCAPCPANRMTSGPPEHVLAGVDVSRSTIAEVSRVYGPPASRSVYAPPGAEPGSGQGEYVWELAGADLKVTTLLVSGEGGKKKEERVSAVTVSLARAQVQRPLATGRGAKIGDTAKTLRRLYGTRFVKETVDSRPRLTYCFEDGTVLYLRFDARGKVEEILLDGSGAAPDPAQGRLGPPAPPYRG